MGLISNSRNTRWIHHFLPGCMYHSCCCRCTLPPPPLPPPPCASRRRAPSAGRGPAIEPRVTKYNIVFRLFYAVSYVLRYRAFNQAFILSDCQQGEKWLRIEWTIHHGKNFIVFWGLMSYHYRKWGELNSVDDYQLLDIHLDCVRYRNLFRLPHTMDMLLWQAFGIFGFFSTYGVLMREILRYNLKERTLNEMLCTTQMTADT